MVAIVLFDLGDVVARFDPAPRIAEYAARSGLTPAEVYTRLSTDQFWRDTDRGRYTGDEMECRIAELLGVAFSREELLRLQAAAFTLRPEMLRLARRAARHARVGLLTNNAPLLKEAVPIHLPELVRAFDPLLYSFEFGATKTEPALFERVTERLGVPPQEIVFVDDQESHVAAARALGWRALRFESAAQLEQSLPFLARASAEIAEEPMTRLGEHAQIPCAFAVERVLEVSGGELRERALERPWLKDYDAIPGNHPRDWPKRFDVSTWCLLAARLEGRRVGGAVLALERERVRAMLWDLRVAPAERGRGIGAQLLAAAEGVARASHFRELEIETQNVNVGACRLYELCGYALAAVDPSGYPELPGETALIWRKRL